MTKYAFDEERQALIATWETGDGYLARTVAVLSASVDQDGALRLAASLTTMSRMAWWTYTHPASGAESVDPNSEGWRRQGEREAFVEVLDHVRKPYLPNDQGYLVQSYVRVEEAAHRVGRALHAIGDQELTDAVATDVQQELAAVEQAELGDFSGRARQAVQLSRADTSPLQVNAAHDFLHAHPLWSSKLFEEVDPTAAAVAAAHWLQAAAEIAGEASGVSPASVVMEADNIEALAVETPTLVLERLIAGESPRRVVVDLVAGAMIAAEGKLPDPDGLVDAIEKARAQAEQYGPGDEELLAGLMPRVTPLDPARPAQDLLEDLLDGIRGCWLLYRSHAELGDDVDLDDEAADEEIDEEFFAAVRAEAEAKHDRLL
ncbi:hypothetical protein [Lentzea cavernae]|uniref:Uncharacterized protein n=1 Tax=Lentzea cavernae TaxID=2020703 RepID=A0ABQ3MSV5_9PSEU|nr:hypothetical protein [Lentzea cavernae]GHH57935.1 hypothetical protein GCM10017774_78520 [Lentzea cavernae]